MRDYKEKDHLEDRKSLKGVPDLRRDNDELKRKQSEGMRKYQAGIKNRKGVKPQHLGTMKLRYVKRSPFEASQHEILVLQQWWWNGMEGAWHDVPVEKEGHR